MNLQARLHPAAGPVLPAVISTKTRAGESSRVSMYAELLQEPMTSLASNSYDRADIVCVAILGYN